VRLIPVLPRILPPLLAHLATAAAANGDQAHVCVPVIFAALQHLLSLHQRQHDLCAEAFTKTLAVLLPAVPTMLPALLSIAQPSAGAAAPSLLVAVLSVLHLIVAKCPASQLAAISAPKADVVRLCARLVGHHKRAVRSAAVRARNAWEALPGST
jgi:hypothetical protein